MRHALEFASQIWDPYQKKQIIRQLEKLQNKRLTSFSQLCKDAGIESLQEHRMSARFSHFTRCLAENIQPYFEYYLPSKVA